MNRLTQEERRRLNQSQQRASEAMLAYPTLPAEVTVGGSRGRTRVLQLVTLLVLLCGGLLAYQVVEFNPPTSLIDAFLPRL